MGALTKAMLPDVGTGSPSLVVREGRDDNRKEES